MKHNINVTQNGMINCFSVFMSTKFLVWDSIAFALLNFIVALLYDALPIMVYINMNSKIIN